MNKIKKYIINLLILSICIFNIGTTQNVSYATTAPSIKFDTSGKPTLTNGDKDIPKKTEALNSVLDEVRLVVVFLSGIGLLTVIALFIINFINLGNSKGNPQARQKAINGLIACGIATAGLGSVTFITKLFFNFL